jgi:hypothetical protein
MTMARRDGGGGDDDGDDEVKKQYETERKATKNHYDCCLVR